MSGNSIVTLLLWPAALLGGFTRCPFYKAGFLPERFRLSISPQGTVAVYGSKPAVMNNQGDRSRLLGREIEILSSGRRAPSGARAGNNGENRTIK